MDGGRENVQFIQQDVLRWRHELNAVCAFIDPGQYQQLDFGEWLQGRNRHTLDWTWTGTITGSGTPLPP